VLQLLKQKAPFPPQLAVHFSAHDVAWAKVEPEKVARQNSAVAISNLYICSSL